MPPRVRFAPSPTGYLHVGGARTALFNWLYARRHGGVFVLRIEDTDADRSSDEMVTGILDGLRWLGVDWDEGPEVGGPHGPYFQAQRSATHRAAAARLVAGGHAYYCYCTAEELRAKREAAEAAGGGWIYDRKCRSLGADDVAAREAAGQSRVIRIRVPDGDIAFDDLVHGTITIAGRNIDDFIIVRSDGSPTYNLSVVADDVDMAITHVVRGDDHISNTPKHVLLFRAFGAAQPQFAHVPLILGADKKRLSKRHGATSVTEYQRQGYLPEALVNFLALLGWAPGDDRELMSRAEMIEAFSLEGISSGDAVFNTEKLDWMNGQYIARLPVTELAERVRPFLVDAGVAESSLVSSEATYHRLLELLRPRAKRLSDFVDQARPLLSDTVEFDSEAVVKNLSIPDLDGHLAALESSLSAVGQFDEPNVERAVRETAAQRALKAGPLIHATRLAVTGRGVSPGLFEVLVLLGRERVLARIAQLRAHLASRRAQLPLTP